MTASDAFARRLDVALSDRYRVERELGEGGMATVYLADDLKHRRKVALKVLKPELAAVVGAERFLAEIETTANLQHPHILPLFDSGEAEGFLYYVMPYVGGESLREKLAREKQLGVEEAVALTRKVADALDYAHGKGIVHRDIKPANILLSERGEPLVADFGIALAVSQAGGGRITETGLSLGTPHYMSPEQATGDRDVDARSDVWAVGCVLYEMLAGEPPFAAPAAQAVLARILTEEPRPLTRVRGSVPPNVSDAVARATEKLPADRFASADAFVRALEDPGLRYGAGSPGAAAPAGGHVRRWWKPAALAALPALLIGALIGRAMHDAPATTSWTFTVDDRLPVSESGVTIGPGGELAYRAARPQDSTGYVPWGLGIPLVVRVPGEREPIVLAGTERAIDGVFSPDGSWFAYRHAGNAAWDEPVMRVSTEGGAPVTVWSSSNDEPSVFWPRSFDVSPGGAMAVLTGLPDWTDFLGAVLASPEGETPLRLRTSYGLPPISLSPDGGSIAYLVGSTMLVQDLETGSISEIEGSGMTGLTWSPDGSALAVGHLSREALLIEEVGESGLPREVEVGRTGLEPTDWLPDGRIVAEWRPAGPDGNVDLLVVDPSDGSVSPLLDGDWTERQGRVSPDGRWLAYESWATGEREFYVRSFPDLGPEVPVSREELGSTTIREYSAGPYWSADGGSLYYLEGGSVWRAGVRSEGGLVSVAGREEMIPVSEFDQLHGVHPDGRLLLRGPRGVDRDDMPAPRLVVVTDLMGELERREAERR